MDSIAFSPLLERVRRSRPAATRQIVSHPQAITAVAVYFSRAGAPMYAHEKVTLSAVAESIARLSSYQYAGVFDANKHSTGELFLVPDDTLMLDEARSLGIHSPCQLYGAVVPYPFAKTKVITHRLINTDAARPSGWSATFAENVCNAVLPGYTVFEVEGARTAAMRLLSRGPVRIKEPLGDGGHGQTVVRTIAELNALLERLATEKIASHGLVLEANLRRVTTRSVGCTMVGDRAIAYHGTQRSVTNNHGLSVYGGSHLICVRGGWAELEDLPMDPQARLAVAQARTYDRSTASFPGFLASRRNYDVGQGLDARGHWRSGVLEASWRSGGASTAELAALTAFARDSALQVVKATSVKRFGRLRNPPPGAVIHFEGDDPEEGPLLRYTMVTRALRHVA
ncbi:DUF3182 family protein [Bradyrhizobium elkanii]|uniref:DUF3182 family protein n=1 Tax=Bradyrhizobium elkanii TaxID=29448 RepID=UPI00086D30EF|nr:DUF3182 family protein [Bradyrhizobium elkanii]ODM71877.1 hypothetical protein A6452_06490 [Bradyrhizobium elkanii]ODM84771.1 hypothetical protein A6X20_12575 [Bradyrhizobium elkanii]